MLALFTNPQNNELIDWVKKSLALTELEHKKLEVIPYSKKGAEVRSYAHKIKDFQACIIDIDVMNIIEYSMELGSLGETLSYMMREDDKFHEFDYRQRHSYLDSKIMLVTKKSLTDHQLTRYFGDFYTSISLENGVTEELTKGLATWISDTVSASIPRVFISYRSSNSDYAQTIADALKRQGAAIWFDNLNILPGDSIITEVNRGLGWCTHLVMIVDETFFESKWTNVEVESILHRHLSGRHYYRLQNNSRPIIPLFLVDPLSDSMPIMLQRIRGIDCRQKDISSIINQLWTAIISVGPI